MGPSGLEATGVTSGSCFGALLGVALGSAGNHHCQENQSEIEEAELANAGSILRAGAGFLALAMDVEEGSRAAAASSARVSHPAGSTFEIRPKPSWTNAESRAVERMTRPATNAIESAIEPSMIQVLR